MRPLRHIGLTLLVLLLLTGMSGVYVGSSDTRSFELLKRLVAWATPYQLELVAPQISWSPFSVSADLILLKYADPDSPPLASVQKLSYSAPITQLLWGELSTGLLRASNVSYFIDESESDEPIDLESLLLPLSLLPAKIEIDSVHFMSQREQLWIFPLLGIDATRAASGTVDAVATANFSGRPALLEAQTDWRALPGGGHRLDLRSSLVGLAEDQDRKSLLRLEGSVQALQAELSYDFQLQGQYQQVSDFVAAFDDQAYPFSGALEIDGQLRGDLSSFDLQIRELTLTTPDAYTFTATGSVTQANDSAPQLALQARGEAQELEALLPLPAALISSLQRSELQLSVAGTLERPNLLETGVRLYLAGDSTLELYSENTELALAALQNATLEQDLQLGFRAQSKDLVQLLNTMDVKVPLNDKVTMSATGRIKGTQERLEISLDDASINQAQYDTFLTASLLWQNDLLSAPALDVSLSEKAARGSVHLQGTIADVEALRGVALQLSLEEFDAALAAEMLTEQDLPSSLKAVSGSALLLRAAEPVLLRNIDLALSPVPGLALQVAGGAEYGTNDTLADLTWTLDTFDSEQWSGFSSIPLRLEELTGQLRLRPNYLTLLSTSRVGDSDLQFVLNADLDAQTIARVNVDLYSQQLQLQDIPLGPSAVSNPDENQADSSNTAESESTWLESLPAYPIHLSLRADKILGEMSEITGLNVELETEQKRFLLSHFDAKYAGGELILRGAADLAKQPAELTLAGQGIRVPLAALIEDLGLQQAVKGALSFRGGVATRGDSLDEALAHLGGRVSIATNDVTVSGAAYDLLMSNLLAWLVQGANKKTTTFDCTMAQFEISNGRAKSDSLFIETERMLATGKATLDFPANTLDVRIEPRSKTRTFQFPSAVRMRGALNDPSISISPLQTTADLSAQALLLLPSLTLRMFGIGPEQDAQRPCQPSLQ